MSKSSTNRKAKSTNRKPKRTVEYQVQYKHNDDWLRSEISEWIKMNKQETIETAEDMNGKIFEYRAVKITTEVLTKKGRNENG